MNTWLRVTSTRYGQRQPGSQFGAGSRAACLNHIIDSSGPAMAAEC
jgi:hypothetical protein